MSAIELLEKAAGHLKDRAETYDKPGGERSIGATVAAFNAVTGDGLMNSEERGWLFMSILKMVRSQQGGYRADNYEDGAAYFALMGEAACEERNGGWTDREIKSAAFKDACDSAEVEWQPIETAPLDGTEILLKIPLRWRVPQGCIGSGDYVSAYWFDKLIGFWRDRTNHWVSPDMPTHWAPLPKPPSE